MTVKVRMRGEVSMEWHFIARAGSRRVTVNPKP